MNDDDEAGAGGGGGSAVDLDLADRETPVV